MILTERAVFPLGYNHCGNHYGRSRNDANNSTDIRKLFRNAVVI